MVRKTAVFLVAAILLLSGAVLANPIPLDYPVPDQLTLPICHDGPFSEGSRTINIYHAGPPGITVTTTTTGLPYKWPGGPIVHTADPWGFDHTFTLRVSSENIDGTVWAPGWYAGKIIFTIDGRVVEVPVRLYIADCNGGAPQFPAPEFPVFPGSSVPWINIGIIGAVLGVIALLRLKNP